MATSYETLWTRWAARPSSDISGIESSPATTMTRSYGSTVLRPGASTIGSEPSTGPHWTVEELDRFALVERVGQAALDHHLPGQAPVLGQAVECHAPGSWRPSRRRARRRRVPSSASGSRTARHSSVEPECSRMVSTTPSSASVVVSPRTRPSAMSRRRRRMILPERVLGRSGTNIRNLGRAIGPMT